LTVAAGRAFFCAPIFAIGHGMNRLQQILGVLNYPVLRGDHSLREHYAEKNPLWVHLPGAIPHLL
jgi:hypothetical protein